MVPAPDSRESTAMLPMVNGYVQGHCPFRHDLSLNRNYKASNRHYLTAALVDVIHRLRLVLRHFRLRAASNCADRRQLRSKLLAQ